MRVVTFDGVAVKKQHKTKDGHIKIVFYDLPPRVVTGAEWEARSKSAFYPDDVRRSDVVRKQK